MSTRTVKKVIGFIEENGLFTPGDTVVVAISGGADSVALLDILASLEGFGLKLTAAHLNHLLRGREADGDEEFVRGLASRYGIPCHTRRVDVREVASRERRSLEDAGRSARYAFLSEVAAAVGAKTVALAHHADDQAETFLLRLLRGSGGSGLCAMAPNSAGLYVRPLLSISRHEIESYLIDREIPWRTDKSNECRDFLRNRIRHELIPLLSGYNPAISERLVNTAKALAADESVLSALTKKAFDRHSSGGDGAIGLKVSGTTREERGIRIRLYRQAIMELRGDLAEISFKHLDAVDRLVFSPKPNAALDLPGRLTVARQYGDLLFQSKVENAPALDVELRIDGPGSYPLPGRRALKVEYGELPGNPRQASEATAFFDPAEAPFPLLVRFYRPGDRINPYGMNGSKKVKDLFIDAKVPLPDRRLVPLLFCGDTLLWVAGVRRGREAAIGSKTVKAVRIELVHSP